jgi:hypothetical protein
VTVTASADGTQIANANSYWGAPTNNADELNASDRFLKN